MERETIPAYKPEELLSKVSNSLVRAYEGLALGIDTKNDSLTQKYSQEFFAALPLQPKEKLQKLFNEVYSDPFAKFFQYVPESQFQVVVSYLEMTTKYRSDDCLKFLVDAITNYEKDEKPLKDELLQLLYVSLSHMLLGGGIFDDSAALKVHEYGIKNNNPSLVSMVGSYIIIRNRSFVLPRSLKDLKRPEQLWKLLHAYRPEGDWNSVRERLIVCDVLLPNPDRRVPAELLIEGKDLTLYYNEAFLLAGRLLDVEKNDFYYIRNLLQQEVVQKEYGNDPRAKELALAYIVHVIDPKSVSLGYLESFSGWLQAYGITADDFKLTRVGYVIAQLLIAGKIELAHEVINISGYSISDELLADVVSQIKADIDAALLEAEKFVHEIVSAYTYNFSGQTLRSKSVALAYTLAKRIERVTSYCKNGLPSIDDIPLVNFGPGFSGKILLVSFKEKLFLRGIRKGDELHRQIFDKFQEELIDLGYAYYPDEEGGATLLVNSSDKTCTIYGDSHEFGACDKTKAQEILQCAFPGWTVSMK